jgi:hypothetical protein
VLLSIRFELATLQGARLIGIDLLAALGPVFDLVAPRDDVLESRATIASAQLRTKVATSSLPPPD